jgi:hypothetical protein
MSSLSLIDKRRLEELFNMSSGYVLNFSDRTFGDFFVEIVKIDIHSEKYQTNGSSKAKKLRSFWKLESDYLVGTVILALVELAEVMSSDTINKALATQCKDIGNRLLAGNVNLKPLKETIVVFDAKHLAEQIQRIEKSIDTDPSLAIGTAKELIETCCKTILAERGKPVSGCPDVPELTKETFKELKLIPDGIPEFARGRDVIKRLLQNLGTIGNNLAELRGLYGTGHGRHGRAGSLAPRHAKLAVGAASTLATFLFDTHKETMP